jgi:D-alanine transaminase
MSRVAYVNGRYLRHRDSKIHIEDRGLQFADSVYEVCEIRDSYVVDQTRHLERLSRSLAELRIGMPLSLEALGLVMRETARRNLVNDGLVYVQVTRGVAPRDHAFPARDVAPTLVVTARAKYRGRFAAELEQGVAVITVPDSRWKRPDIKTTGLLPNVLARQMAREKGAYEAWFVDGNGDVTEGASTNAWIITATGTLITRKADQTILRGITRTTLIDLISRKGLTFAERSFSVAEAQAAREAFITSATAVLLPVVTIDDKPVGNGRPGVVTLELRDSFHDLAEMRPLSQI